MKEVRCAIACTGLGQIFRGYEGSTHQLYQHLRNLGRFDLYAGGDRIQHDGKVLWNIPRGSSIYRFIPNQFATPYRRYQIECLTAGRSLVAALKRRPVDVVFSPDHILAEYLLDVRNKLPCNPNIIFSNGAPFGWSYCTRFPVVHQKSFSDYEESKTAHKKKPDVYFIPNGFDHNLLAQPENLGRSILRLRFRLPPDKFVVLCVASLQMNHKRVDWLMREISNLPPNMIHLVLAGAKTEETDSVIQLSKKLLPSGNITITTVLPDEIPKLLWASNLVVLASLSEGFPRVVAEAMGAHRLVLVHPHKNMKWIVDNPNCLVDMQATGALSQKIAAIVKGEIDIRPEVDRNYRRFRDHFTWDVLIPQYLKMFQQAALQKEPIQLHHKFDK